MGPHAPVSGFFVSFDLFLEVGIIDASINAYNSGIDLDVEALPTSKNGFWPSLKKD